MLLFEEVLWIKYRQLIMSSEDVKPKVLVVNASSGAGDEVIAQLKSYTYDVTRASSLNEGIRLIGQTGFNLSVVDLQHLDEESTTAIVTLHQHLPNLPFLVLAKQISVMAYRKIGGLNNFVALQKPFQDSMFEIITKRIIADNIVIPSVLPRFITDEPVRMMVLRTGLFVPTKMKNYSAGGAFLQYRGISLAVGDQIQLGFTNKAQGVSLKGQIRWIKDGDGPRSPARGVGIQFADS